LAAWAGGAGASMTESVKTTRPSRTDLISFTPFSRTR
jgi:hypothetical protein